MSVYPINSSPTSRKIEIFDNDKNTYYRFQNPEHEMGTQSWGMIYSTPEEALEDGSTVLAGKSCCSTAHNLYNFKNCFDNDYNVLVLKGWFVDVGHDDEDVIDVEEVIEVWSYAKFINYMENIEEE